MIVPAPLSAPLADNVKVMLLMVLLPVVVNVPKSLNAPLPLILTPFGRFQVAPLSLLMTAALASVKLKLSETVPKLFNVRVSSTSPPRPALEIVVLPRKSVSPVPLIVPDAHRVGPITLMVAVPVSVPPSRLKVGKVAEPVPFTVFVKLAVPLSTKTKPVTLKEPATLTEAFALAKTT